MNGITERMKRVVKPAKKVSYCQVLLVGVSVVCVLLLSGCDSATGPDSVNIAGTWTGVFHVNDTLSDCDPNLLLPATANFQQIGANVVGTLKAVGPCGPDYPFEGTIEGNNLSGTITGGLVPPGKASGTLSGSGLQIGLSNGYGYGMGTMQLHR